MSRLIVVANRLPVSARFEPSGLVLSPSPGGLATALRSVAEQVETHWIGWPGIPAPAGDAERDALARSLAELGASPVHLTPESIERFYDGFANGVLWPLFHYLTDKVRLDAWREWETFREVNALFADAVVARYRPGDLVWVHDYQLALVPQLVRARLPEARIGYFLHIPFPADEVFRLLPWRKDLLEGILGSDVVGFQTSADRHHFAAASARVLGLEPGVDTVEHDGRSIRLGAFPISVDFARFSRFSEDATVRAELERLRAGAGDQKILLGVDRLDYTKGIPRKLLAVERLLERDPSLKGHIRVVHIAVPTRERVDAYADYRRVVNELVGRINARFATADWVPIHFLERNLSHEELTSLYLAAEVMVVTPLRDGMNLVAKEFVASRSDNQGVLVLSEFAGAAAELATALIVNPYDVDGMAATLATAIRMPKSEQGVRMRALRRQVRENDLGRWAKSFLGTLDGGEMSVRRGHGGTLPPPATTVEAVTRADRLTIVVDYDGTLVPFAPSPELAAPDPELLELVGQLSRRPGTSLHVISGRLREDLEGWLGALPIGLHAEDGFWSRMAPGDAWIAQRLLSVEWKPHVAAIFEDVARRTVGAFIEEKTTGIAWHYRTVEPILAAARLRELRQRLEPFVREDGLDVNLGMKVLEVRPRSIHKGLAASRIVAAAPANGSFLGIGAGAGDEDLFAALPAGSTTIRVGPGISQAAFRLRDAAAVRLFLRGLAA